MHYNSVMINFNLYNLKIDSAFSLSWKKSSAYARPRKYDALSFRIKGNATYEHGEREYHVEKNDILFVPAHYDYKITANKDEEVFVIHFFVENSNFEKMEIFKPLNPDVFERLFMEMQETWRMKSVGYQAKLTSLFYKIVEQIEVQEYKKNLQEKPGKLQEILDYFHENFTDQSTTIESAAKHIGISSVYLRKLFRSALNETPLHYLNNLRMDYAIGLLKTGYYSIEDISFLSGFNDSKYFSRLYKERTGTLPSKKLKRARKKISKL